MRKFIKNRFKNEKGLTLVELLAVIVILAIVAGIAFVMIGNIIENSKKDAHIANALQLIESAKLYEANGEEIGDGVSAKKLQGEDHELLGELIDPWTKEEYSSLVSESSNTGNGTVTKDGTKYTVKLNASGSKCDVEAEEAELIKGDRKELCDGD